MLTRRWILCSLTVALVLLLAACSRVATATPTAEATAAATARATAALQATLTAAPTVKASATAKEQPSATPTEHPTNPPTATRAATALPSATATVTPTPFPIFRLAYYDFADNRDFVENRFAFINSDGSGLEYPEFLADLHRNHRAIGLQNYLLASPDGRYLAFDAETSGLETYGLYVADMVEGKVLPYFKEYAGLTTYPAWSPDSRRLAVPAWLYMTDSSGASRIVHNLYVFNVETGEWSRLTLNFSHDISPVWSADGQWIAFVRVTGDLPCREEGCSKLCIVRADATGLKCLVENVDNGFEGSYAPTWSFDGQWLAVTNWFHEVFVVRVSDGYTVNLGLTQNNAPQWLPEGNHLLFESWHEGNGEIYTILPDGSGLTNLTNTPNLNESCPKWLASLELVAFIRAETYVMQIDGTSLQQFSVLPVGCSIYTVISLP